MNPQKVPGPGTAVKVLGVIWSDKTHVVPEAVTGKIQAYPTLKNVKGVQVLVGICGVWRIFIPHMVQWLCPSCLLVKKGTVGLGSRAASCL